MVKIANRLVIKIPRHKPKNISPQEIKPAVLLTKPRIESVGYGGCGSHTHQAVWNS
jgi:hypothetical protein